MIIESVFSGYECSLNEILESRERRVRNYTELMQKNLCKNVVVLCVNMPGKVKNNAASVEFYSEGFRTLNELLTETVFINEEHSETGHEAYFGTNSDSFKLKKIILDSEKKHPWMRMLDIDVIDAEIGHIGRSALGEKPLPCFVCSSEAKDCGSRQHHTENEIKEAITDFYIDCVSEKIGRLASDSLRQEALCTPKPGLVDRRNNGSHKDMDLNLMLRSAEILEPYFAKMCKLGLHNERTGILRQCGKEAELAMYNATGNVNTHKGAVFCLGFMSYSYGNCIYSGKHPDPDNICSKIRELTKDFAAEVPAQTVAKRGLGARGQAMNGYKIIVDRALPFFIDKLKNNDINRALCLTLLLILSENDDSNILSRSNAETLHLAQNQCKELLLKEATEDEIEKLDEEFIARNISPGGSADLLSATYFLFSVMRQ